MQLSQQPSPVQTWDVCILVSSSSSFFFLTLHHDLARLAWRSHIADHDAIVYVIDAMDSAGLALSKTELDDLRNDATLSKPILILAPKSNTLGEEELRQQLNIDDAITKVCDLCPPRWEPRLTFVNQSERPAAFFTYSISSTQLEGIEEGW